MFFGGSFTTKSSLKRNQRDKNDRKERGGRDKTEEKTKRGGGRGGNKGKERRKGW